MKKRIKLDNIQDVKDLLSIGVPVWFHWLSFSPDIVDDEFLEMERLGDQLNLDKHVADGRYFFIEVEE